MCLPVAFDLIKGQQRSNKDNGSGGGGGIQSSADGEASTGAVAGGVSLLGYLDATVLTGHYRVVA